MGKHHSHPAAETTKQGIHPLVFAFGLIFGFMFIEFLGGLFSGSLALLADAGHMLTDASAIAISLFALWLSAKPASTRYSYGLKRAEVMAALFNGLLLFALGGWILFEAWERSQSPQSIKADILMAVAAIGLLVNLLAAWKLHAGHDHNLNVKSAFFHVLGDILGSLGAIAAGGIILLTGWVEADLWVSGLIACLIFIGAFHIVQESVQILLDAYPKRIEAEELRNFLLQYPGVLEICDLHVWDLGSNATILTTHLVVNEVQGESFLSPLQSELASRFKIDHATIQQEESACGECC